MVLIGKNMLIKLIIKSLWTWLEQIKEAKGEKLDRYWTTNPEQNYKLKVHEPFMQKKKDLLFTSFDNTNEARESFRLKKQ